MGKALVIAEKPSVATDISKALGGMKKVDDHYEGDGFIVASAVGHLLELKEPAEYEVKRGKWSFASLPVIPSHFDLVPIKKSESRLSNLKRLIKSKDVDCLINACDAGREGELIFRYIVEAAKTKKPIKRLWLQSMTKSAILEAFKELRSDEEMLPLAAAAKSRSEADWIVGINGTRALTAFNSKEGGFFLTTVGRVQTPTLALVAKREEQIRKFEPRDYWEVHAEFEVSSGTYKGRWFNPKFAKSEDAALKAERLWSAQEAQKIADFCKGKTGTVSETSKSSASSCPALYDLTTLQREANSRFGFSAKTTLAIAQALYEKHKLLTYPRTDARALPEDYLPTVKETLSTLSQSEALTAPFARRALSEDYVVFNKKIFDNSKISDHFAIIPTTQAYKPGQLSEAEQKVYELVCKRFIAVFYPPAKYLNTTRTTLIAPYSFLTEGKVLTEPGWTAVYGRGIGQEEDTLVPVKEGESAHTEDIRALALQTKPPARYTEATLLSAMEGAGKSVEEAELREAMKEKGIGTPATRASIIEGLITQSYMIREGRELVPTAKASQLLTLLKGLNIEVLSEAELTGEWEYKLSLIEKGKLSRETFMSEIDRLTRGIVEQAKSYGESTVPIEHPAVLKAPCPKCGGTIVETYKRFSCRKCDYSIPKHPGGRTFSAEEVDELLSKGKIGPLEGFISKMGRPFAAELKLGPAPDYKIDFDFGDKPAAVDSEGFEALKAGPSLGKCPVCGDKVVETESAYVCLNHINPDKDPKCSFRSSKVILQQPVTPEQMEKLLDSGSTDLLRDFVSNRTKKKFSAFLTLGADGKVGFKFEEKAAAVSRSRTKAAASPEVAAAKKTVRRTSAAKKEA